MRICLVYDCLFPWTVGGAERWYRSLAETLAAQGHEVTYLTLRQWAEDSPPNLPGIDVIPVGPRLALMAGGRRRVLPPLRFGAGVFCHLLLHGRRYDHVHCASFPYFSVLAIGFARLFAHYTIGVDWHEVWTLEYWRSYLGRIGFIGWLIQWLCARVPQQSFVFSRLHGSRLEKIGRLYYHLPGEYAGGAKASSIPCDPPALVYAGRLIPEKRVDLLIEAFALARMRAPALRLVIYGDGPERNRLIGSVLAMGLNDAISMPGFVAEEELDRAMREAAAIVQPSAREGYGMVVVEAAARSVPAIVVESPDNAAIELIEPGQNGLIAKATAQSLSETLLVVVDDNTGFRQRTAAWYAINAQRLSLTYSLDLVTRAIVADKVSFDSSENSN